MTGVTDEVQRGRRSGKYTEGRDRGRGFMSFEFGI